MVKVVLRKSETQRQLFRRFKKTVSHSGVMSRFGKDVGLFLKMSSAGWQGEKQFGNKNVTNRNFLQTLKDEREGNKRLV